MESPSWRERIPVFSGLVSCHLQGAEEEETKQSRPRTASLLCLTVTKIEKDWGIGVKSSTPHPPSMAPCLHLHGWWFLISHESVLYQK